MPPLDFSALTLPEHRAWRAALRGAIAALEASGGGEVALLADAEGVSVASPFLCNPVT